MEVLIRGAEEGDLNFVLSTWLRGQYYGCHYQRQMEKSDWMKAKKEEVCKIILNPSNSLRIAILNDSEGSDLILGWVCLGWAFKKPVIHWAYVKAAFRKQGICKKLLENVESDTVTNINDLGNDIRKAKGFKFNPYVGQGE